MEAIRDANLPLRAECGGSCSCATCHVYVDAEWRDKLPPREDLESDLVDLAFEAKEASRLSCQISLVEAYDGLRLTLAPGTD
jgi:2Fe-2S ferredoxin